MTTGVKWVVKRSLSRMAAVITCEFVMHSVAGTISTIRTQTAPAMRSPNLSCHSRKLLDTLSEGNFVARHVAPCIRGGIVALAIISRFAATSTKTTGWLSIKPASGRYMRCARPVLCDSHPEDIIANFASRTDDFHVTYSYVPRVVNA